MNPPRGLLACVFMVVGAAPAIAQPSYVEVRRHLKHHFKVDRFRVFYDTEGVHAVAEWVERRRTFRVIGLPLCQGQAIAAEASKHAACANVHQCDQSLHCRNCNIAR